MQHSFSRLHRTALSIVLGLCTLVATASPHIASAMETERRDLASGSARLDDRKQHVVVVQDATDADAILATAQTLDEAAQLLHRSDLLPRHLWMNLDEHAAHELRKNSRVLRVVADQPETRTIRAQTGVAARAVARHDAVPAIQANSNPEAGKGIRIAIISTGVDYTHAALGGDGKPETYNEALVNEANFWPGFPTAVVVGGLDAASEVGSIDPNPIEYSVAGIDKTQYPSIPLERGTRVASIVHALAPAAELLAYKTWFIKPTDRGEIQARRVDSADMERVYQHILDPDQDGDTSDRADIVLIDSVGGLAFYSPFEDDDSGDSLQIDFLQALAAKGVLVVTDSGHLIPESRHGISWMGATPDALTVAAMEPVNGDGFAAAGFSARGPVRGPAATIKPDLVDHGVDIPVAVPGSGDGMDVESTGWAAAARVAAAAAILKSERPGLSPLQLKSALANTAHHDVLESAATTRLASVPMVGMGRINIDAALASNAIIYSKDNHQPTVNFGFHEIAGIEEYQQQLVIHNLSDDDQLYTLSDELVGANESHAALNIDYPATVNVPANHQVTIPFSVTVDPAGLAPWPITDSGDYVESNWREVQLGGYLNATSGTGEMLSVGWMITPRPRATIRKNVETLEEIFDSPLKAGFSDDVAGFTQTFTNTASTETTYLALPVMAERRDPPAAYSRSHGHFMKHLASGVYDEAACTVTGRKLMLAVSMHRPAEVAAANYFDKIGDPIIYFEIFREGAVLTYGYDVSVGPGNLGQMTEADYINYGWVSLDENGQPVTVTIDLDQPYDILNPTGRYQISNLPVLMPTHSRSAVAQVCIEDLFHHDFVDESELDKNIGFVIATDRDVMPTIDTPIIQFNPIKFGYEVNNFLSVINTGAKVSLNNPDDADTFSNTITLAPGESGLVTALKHSACDGFGFITVKCNRSFMLLGLNSDLVVAGKVLAGDGSSIAYVRENQVFDVDENAVQGHLVGKLELDAPGFFAFGPDADNPHSSFSIHQVNAIPGDPFRIEADGSVVVNNADAIDHEAQSFFRLVARTKEGNAYSASSDVMINVGNINDNAPTYRDTLESVTGVVGHEFTLSLADHFEDADGDALAFSITGLPTGMTMTDSTGSITGTPESAGEYPLELTVSDGIHETLHTMTLVIGSTSGDAISVDDSDSGGGAFGLPMLLFMLAGALRCQMMSRGRRIFSGFTRRKEIRMNRSFISTLLALLLVLPLQTGANESKVESKPAPASKLAASAEQRLLYKYGKPQYFVHLDEAPLALHAQRNLSGTMAFSGNRLRVDAMQSRIYTQHLQSRQESVLSSIHRSTGSRAELLHQHTLAINAMLMAMDESDVEKVRSLPGVRLVERVSLQQLHTDSGPAHVDADTVWNGVGALPGTKGEGVVVGIIDTGIRTDHPSFADRGGDGYDHTNPLGTGNYLGDCLDNFRLCNDKLIGVVSYPEITDAYNGVRPADGYDYNGHGTHVASTAAGNVLRNIAGPNNIGGDGEYQFASISGVAPHANIVSYQVCEAATGACMPPLAVRAVEHAIENNVDVLNYSIGGGTFSPWEAANAMAFLSARAAGIHVATSAGNSGPGESTVTVPGNSPWITTVAAYTHDRGISDPSLTRFTGGTNPPRGDLSGYGLTNGYTGAVVYAGDYRDPLCLNPFIAGTFRGQIVICERGTNARVEKGRNVLAGGAGGMILINTRDTDDDLFSDFHELPAIHVNQAAGTTLLAWLRDGVGHSAQITAGGPVPDPAVADIAGTFSSRGPILPYGSLPGPDVAAPGVDILAAWVQDLPFTGNGFPHDYAFLNGTSMSSPHVAGALALLTDLHPGWSPAELQSALVTTAERNTFIETRSRSTAFDHGGGRIDIPAAATAGLVMDISEAEYRAADPALGGMPETLNQPILIQDSCMIECSWTRTVKATAADTWNVTAIGSAGMDISVEPANFTLATGEEQTITISASLNEAAGEDWQHGNVTLTPRNAGVSATTMPVSTRMNAGQAPEFVTLQASTNRGASVLRGFRSIGTDSLNIRVNGLVKAELHEARLAQDPTPDEPVDSIGDAVHVIPVNTHTGTHALIVEILEAESPDLDLYIARDMNFDGKPNGAELLTGELCTSGSPESFERCVIADPPPGVYWIAIVNFAASGPDALDRHLVSVATLEGDAQGLQVTGPGSISNGEVYDLQATWDFDMQPGDKSYALITVGTSPQSPSDIGSSLLRLDRVADPLTVSASHASVIASQAVSYTWSVPASTGGGSSDQLLTVQLPAGMTVTTDESGEVQDDVAVWQFSSAAGETTGSITVVTPHSEVASQLALEFALATGEATPVTITAPPVQIHAAPVALINGKASESLTAAVGETIDLDVSGSTGPDASALEFEWRQESGASAAPVASASGEYTLTIPTGSEGSTLVYELVAISQDVASHPAILTITVTGTQADDDSGGGATGPGILLAILLFGLFRRRR